MMEPIGMVRLDDLLARLTGLAMTGGCDPRTLEIVAQTVGIGPHFRAELQWRQTRQVEIVAWPELVERVE